jgi:hypothetical protein
MAMTIDGEVECSKGTTPDCAVVITESLYFRQTGMLELTNCQSGSCDSGGLGLTGTIIIVVVAVVIVIVIVAFAIYWKVCRGEKMSGPIPKDDPDPDEVVLSQQV